MRERMVVVADVDPRHGSGAERVTEGKADNAGEIAFEGELHHVHHATEPGDVVVAVLGRYGGEAFRRYGGRIELHFERTHARQILVELGTIVARELWRKTSGIRDQVVENTLVALAH